MRCTAKSKRVFIYIAAAVLFLSASFSSWAIKLGATDVPKSKIWAYILVGNSALSGRDPVRDTVISPYAWKYVLYNNNPLIPIYTFQPAKEPLCQDVRNDGSKGGPSLPFLKKMSEKFPDYYFVSLQKSGAAWTCKNMFIRGQPQYDSVIAPAKKLKDSVTIAAIISMFGLVEVEGSASGVESYPADVKTMVDQMRTDLGMPTLPYIHSGYPVLAQGSYAVTTANGSKLVQNEKTIPQTVTNCVLIPTDSLTIYQDNFLSHFDRAGNVKWGSRVVDSLISRKWTPLPSGAGPVRPGRSSRAGSAQFQKVFFNGNNHQVFSMSKKALDIYLPNGREVAAVYPGNFINHKLLPGVYLVRLKQHD
jgi:hypothetical protein